MRRARTAGKATVLTKIGIISVVFLRAHNATAEDISVIRPFSSSSPIHISRLERPELWRAPEASTALLESTDQAVVQATSSGPRPPAQAVSFLEKLDHQLGLSAEMSKEKKELMTESAHAFFRASPALFYSDLQGPYQEASRLLPETAPRVAIVGDAHLLNAGTFRGPDGTTVWGLNDFDQAEIGSPEWDLERMGSSLYVAARSGGLSSEESLDLVRQMGQSYLANLGSKGPAYLHRSETDGKVAETIDKAGSKDQKKFLAKWTNPDGRSLLRGEDLEDPDPKRGAQIQDALHRTFPELEFLDLASKPHSGGSTRGLERYYALVDNPGSSPWILEVKAVLPSPVQVPDGDLSRGDGGQILNFQKQMGSPVDHRHRAFKLDGVAFFTREREREKDAVKDKPKHLSNLAPLLGKVLARAHNSSGADLKGWVNGRDDQLLDNLGAFSQSYARQVESDFREFSAKYAPPPGSTPPPPADPAPEGPPSGGYLLSP